MARRLAMPAANELICAPGDVVRVNRRIDGEFEQFEDTVSEIEILVMEGKWSAYYYFRDHDDSAKHFEIKEVIARPRTYNPLPAPKYDKGEVIKYIHHWDKEKHIYCDEIHAVSVVWHERESAIRYSPERPTDHIYETDVIQAYVPKETPHENPPAQVP